MVWVKWLLGQPWQEQPQTSYIITSGYDCRNKCVFSFRRNNVDDCADVMSSGRLFHSFRPAEAKWSFDSCNKTRRMVIALLWYHRLFKPKVSWFHQLQCPLRVSDSKKPQGRLPTTCHSRRGLLSQSIQERCKLATKWSCGCRTLRLAWLSVDDGYDDVNTNMLHLWSLSTVTCTFCVTDGVFEH